MIEISRKPVTAGDRERPDSPTFTITVRYLRAQANGETVCVGVELTDHLRNLSETRRYTVHTSLLSELSLHRGLISQDQLDELERIAQLSAAWQRALSILAYGSNSAQALLLKLRQRGFDEQTARAAIDLIRKQGYLKEDQDAAREARRCVSKGWGKKRIEQYLRQRGYPAPAAQEAVQALDDVDFDELCCRVARKYTHTPPSDAKSRQKVVAYLLRYGYDMTAIRHTLDKAWK